MAESLQKKVLLNKLHIALFFFVIFFAKSSQAQSLLLPGDIVFVSVSADSNSFEFVPLINLEKGTRFSFSNGSWDNSEQVFFDNGVVEFTAQTDIDAGTPIMFDKSNSAAFTIHSDIIFNKEQESLFVFQNDIEEIRFIFALGWGEKQSRRDKSFFGSEIPPVFKVNPKAMLSLGGYNNYQYFIRNGASGTPKMLLEFITNASYWRGSNDTKFSVIGTTFNLLIPPVILFDQSLNSIKETNNKTSLNIAIYEHDGSKLTVDVVFDSLYSSLDSDEIKGFKSQKVNFTGLIGDAVYEIEVPIEDDNEYEGTETGIFSLQNLSKGSYGDFISHTVIVLDDDLPELKLELTNDIVEDVILIHNLERKGVDIGNWELSRSDFKINFFKNTFIGVGESLIVLADNDDVSFQTKDPSYVLDKEEMKILVAQGLIKLKNSEGEIITEVDVPKRKQKKSNILSQSIAIERPQTNIKTPEVVISANSKEVPVAGWKANSSSQINVKEFSTIDFYFWSESDSKFLKVGDDIIKTPEDVLLIGNFDDSSLNQLEESIKQPLKTPNEGLLQITLSATDSDGNGIINGLEGTNLIKNNTTVSVTVEQLVQLLQDKLELENEIDMFKSSPDFSNISLLSQKYLLKPDEVFWVKLNSEVLNPQLDINLRDINVSNISVLEDEKGKLELEISSQSKRSSFQINFDDEDTDQNKLNLSLNSNLYLNQFDEIVLSGMVGEDYYDVFGIDSEIENITQLPLQFASLIEGEFELKVKNWTDIPEGWVIKVEDLKDEKSYEINENWSIIFTHTNISSISTESNESKFPSIEERFLLRLIPKSLVDIDEIKELPSSIELHQNYPNPFNPSTTISFYMPDEANVKLSVFNIVGQPIALLLQESRAKGEHTIEWDASDMPSGIYIYQLEIGTKIMTRKMTLVK